MEILLYWDGAPEVLAHECAHAVFDIFQYVGINRPQECGNEPFCYLMDFLFREIWNHGKAKDEKPQGGDLPADGPGGADPADSESPAPDAAG